MIFHRFLVSFWLSFGILEGIPAFCSQGNPPKSNEYALFLKGAKAMLVKDWDRAIQWFTKAIINNQKVPEAYFCRGVAFYQKGLYEKAIGDLSYPITLNPNQQNPDAYYERAKAFCKIGKCDKAIDDYSSSIRLNPTKESAFEGRAFAYEDKGEFANSIRDLDKVIKLMPNEPEGYYNRGRVFVKMKRFQAAFKDFSTVIKINPNYAWAYHGRETATFLGIIQMADLDNLFFGVFPKITPQERMALRSSLQDMDMAIRLQPARAFFEARGVNLLILKEFDKANFDLSKAIQMEPRKFQNYYFRTCAYIAKKEYKNAVADATALIRVEPKNPSCYLIRGWVYFRAGDYPLAIQDANRSREIAPSEDGPHSLRFLSHMGAREFGKAFQDLIAIFQIGLKRNVEKGLFFGK